MIGGKDWLDLIFVSVIALGVITLMLVIQAAQRGRTRAEILRAVAFVWGAVALTLAVAWLLEDRWGGSLIDVQVTPRPQLVTRPLSAAQSVILGLTLAVMLAAYIAVILAVRRLLEPGDGLTVSDGDDPGGEAP